MPSRLAWSLCAVSLALLALAPLLAFLGRSTPLPEWFGTWQEQIIYAIGASGAPVLGGLIAARRPENPYGWLWCGLGLAAAVLFFVQGYVTYALAGSRALPVPGAVLMVGGMGGVIFVALTPFSLLLFPDGRLPSSRWRLLVWTVIAAGVVSLISATFTPGQSGIAPVENPFEVGGVPGEVASALAIAGVLVIFGCTFLSAISLVFRFLRAGGVERQQIKWFAYAAVVLCADLLFSFYPMPTVWNALLETVAFGCVYVAVGIAILKYRLYDIDLVINRTLVYGALTACVVGLYVLVVGGFGAFLRVQGNILVSILAAGLVAVLFQPLRYRLQRGVNHLMYGDRDEPYAVLSRLGQRLESTLAPEAVLPAIVETVAGALKSPHAEVLLLRDGSFETAARYGTPTGEPLVLPLVYGNEMMGKLAVSPRAKGESFTPADQRLLEDLARQAGIAAHAVRLTDDLQRSRERLVTAREEERRRLRRDLHDGVGPRLAALTLKIETARNRLAHDPASRDLLSDLAERAREAVADVRRSVHALRPPILDDLGLVPALRETAAQYSHNGLNVSVEASVDLTLLPAAVEVAAYRIAQEAMANVVRHAGAHSCAVRFDLDEEAGVLRLEVEDDGRGIGEDRGSGVGLFSISERAEELGGTCVAGPTSAGGTRVRAELPFLEVSGKRGKLEADV